MSIAANSRGGAALFIAIGIVALLIGVWQGVEAWQFIHRAATATGHVVAVPGQESPTMSSAHPMVEFVTGSGQIVRYRQNGMGARPIGAPVDVSYDPANPAGSATVQEFWTIWLPVVLPIILGAAFILLPLLGVEVGLSGARP